MGVRVYICTRVYILYSYGYMITGKKTTRGRVKGHAKSCRAGLPRESENTSTKRIITTARAINIPHRGYCILEKRQ